VVCQEALLQGEITIGAGTVIHPKAQILAEAGPIVIGENNLVEENAVIANRLAFLQIPRRLQIFASLGLRLLIQWSLATPMCLK
jgi:carbonic anhydrase/acetyltransferase-like protein (isoleucine patch superfamily)